MLTSTTNTYNLKREILNFSNRRWVPQEPVIHIDDSDVVKPDGYKFEALELVRDSSKSTASKTVYGKGYHVTEACVLTKSNHPVSIFQKFILQKKNILPLYMMLLFLQWNVVQLSLEKQPLPWTEATMTTRCFWNLMNWNRTMSSVLLPKVNSSSMEMDSCHTASQSEKG